MDVKEIDRMVMHNGRAGITVGVQAIDEGGRVVIYGTISAARTTSRWSERHHLDDPWDRRIGLNRVTGTLDKAGRAIFKMGEYGGTNLRADIFNRVRDIVRKQKQRRSVLSLRNRLIRLVNPSFRFATQDEAINFSYEACVSDPLEDEGIAIPMMGCQRRGKACSSQPATTSIASTDDIFRAGEPVLEFDLGGEG